MSFIFEATATSGSLIAGAALLDQEIVLAKGDNRDRVLRLAISARPGGTNAAKVLVLLNGPTPVNVAEMLARGRFVPSTGEPLEWLISPTMSADASPTIRIYYARDAVSSGDVSLDFHSDAGIVR